MPFTFQRLSIVLADRCSPIVTYQDLEIIDWRAGASDGPRLGHADWPASGGEALGRRPRQG